jgi:hypothetical protein
VIHQQQLQSIGPNTSADNQQGGMSCGPRHHGPLQKQQAAALSALLGMVLQQGSLQAILAAVEAILQLDQANAGDNSTPVFLNVGHFLQQLESHRQVRENILEYLDNPRFAFLCFCAIISLMHFLFVTS